MKRIFAFTMVCIMLFGPFGSMVGAAEMSESASEGADSERTALAETPGTAENKATEQVIHEAVSNEMEAKIPDETSAVATGLEETIPSDTVSAETAAPEASEATTEPTEGSEVAEPEISPLDNELEVGDTLVPAYMLDPNRPVPMSAGETVTITRKIHFNIPETDYWWRSSLMGYKNGRWWTASALYFELSDGRTGFCIQPSYDGPSGEVPSLRPGGQYVDSEGWPAALGYSNGSSDTWFIDQTSKTAVARILAIGAPNNGDITSAALEATALAIWDAVTGYMNPNGTWRWGLTSGAFYANTWGARDEEYKKILNALAHFDDIPSFTSRNPANIPTYELTYHSDRNVYDVLLNDTNGVLENKFNFVVPDELRGEITLAKRGNSLHVTVTAKGVEALKNGECMIQNRNRGIEVGANACTVYGNGLRSQKLVVLDRPIDPTPCYFRIHAKPQGGTLKIEKTTNTGESLGGWQFGVYTDSDCTNPVHGSPFITNASGLITQNLPAGTYFVKEITHSSGYWEVDPAVKSVNVSNGATASVSFRNTQYGRLKVTKNAINGSARDWVFDVYNSGGSLVATLTTDSSGTSTTGNLLPGIYAIRERHDENRDYYWTYDVESEKTVEIRPGATADVSFTNTENGRIRIQKTLENFNYPLNIWRFEIRDAFGNPIAGSPFCTDGSGQITTGQLAPGTYTVKEILPSDSLFLCKTEGNVTVTVVNGETAEVSFVNTLRPGEISILKLDQNGDPLADARFLLEWSEDNGVSWHPVARNPQSSVVTGGCSSASLTDYGTLVTGADGKATFTGLHPGLNYRLTETEAPAGYQLLKDTAWEGKLPKEDLTVSLRVVNYPTLALPETGSKEMTMVGLSLGVCLAAASGIILYLKRKEK